MTREVATCGEADTAVSITERMTANRVRHIPVVDRDRLVGIVSIGDIVKHRLWSRSPRRSKRGTRKAT